MLKILVVVVGEASRHSVGRLAHVGELAELRRLLLRRRLLLSPLFGSIIPSREWNLAAL